MEQFNQSHKDTLTRFSLSTGSELESSFPEIISGKIFTDLWINQPLETQQTETVIHNFPEKLQQLCFHIIYQSLKCYQSEVCRSVYKLPNNCQNMLIKDLLDEQLLTSNLLEYFCVPGSCLTSLDLSYSVHATNEILKTIGKCLSLQELILDNEDHVFSNEGLWYLRYCINLRRLSMNYCSNINDWGIQVVGFLPALTVLAIKSTSVTNVGLKHIYLHLSAEEPTKCLPLRSIDLSVLTITDESLPSLAIFSQLELLNIGSTHITNPSWFPNLPNLRHIDISNCHDLVWDKIAHVKSLSDSFPNLTSINVRGVSNLNLINVTLAISHCKYLRQIDGIFCHPEMTASLVASLSHLPLETIILTNCRHVTDIWLPVLARFSSTLTHLVLSSCSEITGDNNSLINNLGRLRNLSWLDLTHLENVNVSQIYQLVLGDYFQKLQILWISLSEDEEIEFTSFCKNIPFKINITKSFINPMAF